MDQRRTQQSKASAFNTMRAKGLGLCALGFAMLSLPLFAGESPMLIAYASALRPAGWFALAAGIVLLGIHHTRNAKRAQGKASPLPPMPSAPSGAPTLREIRDELKKQAGTPDS